MIAVASGVMSAALVLMLIRMSLDGPDKVRKIITDGPVEMKEDPVPDRETGRQLRNEWRKVSESSPDASVVFLEGLDAGESVALVAVTKARERQLAFDRLAELDRRKALQFAEREWPIQERLKRITGLVCQWAVEDPDACWDWLDEQDFSDEPDAWNGLLRSVYIERSHGEPTPDEIDRTWAALEDFAERAAAGRLHLSQAGVVVEPKTRRPRGSTWFLVREARKTGNWQTAMERLAGLKDVNRSMFDHVARNWMALDMDAALSWAVAIEDEKIRKEALLAMRPSTESTDNWTQVELNSRAHFTWLIENGIVEEAARCVGDNVNQAAQWLASVEAGDPRYDGARVRLANTLVNADIQAAATWANAVTDADVRKQRIDYVMRSWASIEPSDAENFARNELGWDDQDWAEVIRKRK